MKELENKKILMLCPRYFGYENDIKIELQNNGAYVILYDERPDNKFLTKLFIRINFKYLIKNKIKNYYNNIIYKIKNIELDYIIIISPETIEVNILNDIKKSHPKVKIYLYMWDSFQNKNAIKLIEYVDKAFTFDPSDLIINKKIKFLPLFYINDYEKLSKINHSKEYDILFVGTIRSDRYRIVKEFKNKYKIFYYFYSPSKLLFILQKIFIKDFRNIPISEIHFESLRKDKLLELINSSKAIIDIEPPKQNGLTMRTIEMLGAKKKFITTNINIKDYDFYNNANILIIDRKNPKINKEFLDMPYEDIPESIYEKYSLKNWIHFIFKN